jgi:hypothetical protein
MNWHKEVLICSGRHSEKPSSFNVSHIRSLRRHRGSPKECIFYLGTFQLVFYLEITEDRHLKQCFPKYILRRTISILLHLEIQKMVLWSNKIAKCYKVYSFLKEIQVLIGTLNVLRIPTARKPIYLDQGFPNLI